MDTDTTLPQFTVAETDAIRKLLATRYAGVFPPEAMESHLRDYVGFPFALGVADLVTRRVPAGGRVLDLGCGFGAFTLLLRLRGYDSLGLEIDPDDLRFARLRAAKVLPGPEAEALYRQGDATRPDLPDGQYDAVVCWNLLEHVPRAEVLFAQVRRLLRPGGSLFAICPNYWAFRNEAHYLVPWRPLLSRRAAGRRLRRLGKDPTYFETAVFQRSNWSVLFALHRTGFAIRDLLTDVRLDLRPDNLPALLGRLREALRFYHPLKDSILVRATKGETR